jgi:hypothetical protein
MNLQSLVQWLKGHGITLAMLVALAGAVKFLLEYIRDNKRKRMELYINLRENFRENDHFDKIFKALDQYEKAKEAKDDSAKVIAREMLKSIPYEHRYEFVAFLEDVAMAVNSGALRPSVANYMFGYYAITCWDVDELWADIRECKNDPYWALFKRFVERLEWHRKILETFPRLVIFWMRV